MLPEQAMSAQNPLADVVSFLASPLNILLIVVGVLGVLFVVLAIVYIAQRLQAPAMAKGIASWLTSPTVEAIVLALDPMTRVAKLIPVKRVGLVYQSTEGEPSFTVPVRGGEIYTLEGTAKPLIVAVRHGRFGVQWILGEEQAVSLSLMPLASKSSVEDLREAEYALITEIENNTSEITGEVLLSPGVKVFVSTRPHRALESLKALVAYATSVNLSALVSVARAIHEEGLRLMEVQARIQLAKRWQLIMAIVLIAVAIAVVLGILVHLGVLGTM
jgi:heme/copper-type cytochrome/quinol oxidase subunit 2